MAVCTPVLYSVAAQRGWLAPRTLRSTVQIRKLSTDRASPQYQRAFSKPRQPPLPEVSDFAIPSPRQATREHVPGALERDEIGTTSMYMS